MFRHYIWAMTLHRIAFPRPAVFVPAFLRGVLTVLACLTLALASPSRAADRAEVAAFLEVTGFDVAIDSIAQSASDAPQMLGAEAGDFGLAWERLTSDVFDTAEMRDMATDILEQTLSTAALHHAAEFYASDLGQRFVAAENLAHRSEDPASAREIGDLLIEEMRADNDPRIALFRDMNTAIGGTESAIRAVQEVQFRFLMAASAAGVAGLLVDAQALRALMKSQEEEMRRAMLASSLAHSAYTYRTFSVAEIKAYVEALEQPLMQEVYELLNAVQFEIQANRFEELAHRMSDLQPVQDL